MAKSGYKTVVITVEVKEATACLSNVVLANVTEAGKLRRVRPVLKHITICGAVFFFVFCPCNVLITCLYPGLKEGFKMFWEMPDDIPLLSPISNQEAWKCPWS